MQHKCGILAMAVNYGTGAGGEVKDGVRHMAFGLADGRCVHGACTLLPASPPFRFIASSNPQPSTRSKI